MHQLWKSCEAVESISALITSPPLYFQVDSLKPNLSVFVKQARKLQATLVRVRNYDLLTGLLTDGGEV